MFNLPGVSIMSCNQRSFTKTIKSLHPTPHRKSTLINLERIRGSVEEFCDISPTDAAICKSIRTTTIQRLTRNFYWKCMYFNLKAEAAWCKGLMTNVTMSACQWCMYTTHSRRRAPDTEHILCTGEASTTDAHIHPSGERIPS
jgi:hypothetical protein